MQHLCEGLSRGAEVKAFPRSVVVSGNEAAESSGREGGEVGFARHEAAHPADGVLDAAFLPGRVGVAKEGFDREAVQGSMAGELGAVVEGDGLTKRLRQGAKQIDEMTSATGWQRHSVRGAISGALKKKAGLTILSEKTDGGRVYRIPAGDAA